MDKNIRNFVVISHIDHGKSTLADRFLELTGTVNDRKMKEQYLDQLELERERGITIKMAPVRMIYRPAELLNPESEIRNDSERIEIRNSNLEIASSRQEFVLNLIDTPGHSDFSYEVSRALKAVEGAILLVDATQGVQAQTLANLESAKEAGLTIIGALNKIDLHPDGVDEMRVELSELLGVGEDEIHNISAKTGDGVEELLNAVIEKIPSPKDRPGSSALIFSSIYNDHKGVVAFVRVFGGTFRTEDKTKLQATGEGFKIKEVGSFSPEFSPEDSLGAGEIGYIATGLKDPDSIRIGDTIGDKALPGFKVPNPVVLVSFYPHDAADYDDLRTALHKLRLNDSSLTFTPDFSQVLGRGFKCGFLGRLHFEITMQRLQGEFDQDILNSFPSVGYRVLTKNRKEIVIDTPKDFPEDADKVFEPYVRVKILVPERFLGPVLELRNIFRLGEIQTETLTHNLQLTAEMPLADLILDFDDKLKSVSQGFASFVYEPIGFKEGDVKKLDILVAGEKVPGLSRIVPTKELNAEARKMVKKLKGLLPRQQFAQAVQAVVGGDIVARETISALRKNVTGGLYGGDRTRKDKLLKKQKKGKKKLKARGHVEVSPEVFRELLKR